MAYPKVTFYHHDPERLANYVCYLAKQIACRYYQDRRFLVLPRLIAHSSNTVYFPDIQLPQKIWTKLSKFNQDDFVFYFENELTNQVTKLLSTMNYEHFSARNGIEKTWQAKENDFFKTLVEFFPTLSLNKVKQINILVSPFGTSGSFFFKKDNSGFYTFDFTQRVDFGPAEIAEKTLSLLVHIDKPTRPLSTWYEEEVLVDYLLTKSKLGAIFNFDYSPTVGFDPVELPSNLIAESNNYLIKLGFSVKSITGLTNNERITINDEPIRNTFTPSEKRILIGLIQNKNKLITYDQIGDWFWGEEGSLEKFSLQSIAKIMEKIRKKIKDLRVYQELIYTVRGQGYVLYD